MTGTGVGIIDISEHLTLSGGTPNVLTAYYPYALIYWAVGNDGNTHLYGLDLTNDSPSVPTPTQLSSFSVASASTICDYGQALTNTLSPSTWFIVIHLTSTTCGSTSDTYEVVHYTDSPSTAPTSITLPGTAGRSLSGDLDALYAPSGALAGLLFVNGGTMYEFADDTFTSPTTVQTGITSSYKVYASTGISNAGSYTGTTLFYSITTATGTNLFRVPYSGTAGNVYSPVGSIGSLAVSDATNVYILDSTSSQTNIVQVPISGATTTTLTTFTTATLGTATLDGSNGTDVVFHQASVSGSAISSTLEYVTVGTSGQTPSSFANSAQNPNPISGALTVQLLSSTLGNYGGELVYVSAVNVATSSTTFATEVVSSVGDTISGGNILNNSVFLSRGTFLSQSILRVAGITDTNGGWGGGTLYNVDMASASLAATPFVTEPSGTSSFVLAAGESLSSFGISGTYAEGYLIDLPGPTFPGGLALDVSTQQIRQFTVPDLEISSLE